MLLLPTRLLELTPRHSPAPGTQRQWSTETRGPQQSLGTCIACRSPIQSESIQVTLLKRLPDLEWLSTTLIEPLTFDLMLAGDVVIQGAGRSVAHGLLQVRRHVRRAVRQDRQQPRPWYRPLWWQSAEGRGLLTVSVASKTKQLH